MTEANTKAETAQGTWSRERAELVRRTICPKGISEDEFALFIEQCKRSGLDPLLKEAFCVARRQNVLDEAKQTILRRVSGARVDTIALDVANEEEVSRVLGARMDERPADMLVNNAGVVMPGRFLELASKEFRQMMEVNYFGALRVTRAVLPSMIARRSGTIVNVSSIVGAVPCPTVASYCGTKAALNAWSHALRGEVAQHGVRVVVFLPSHTDTEQALASTRFDGVIALRADSPYSRVSVENAGSYRPAPMPTPITSQATTNTARFGDKAWIARPTASSTALPASTGRPPCRSTSTPTRGETRPDTSNPTDSAPTTQPIGQPVASVTGLASTAGR